MDGISGERLLRLPGMNVLKIHPRVRRLVGATGCVLSILVCTVCPASAMIVVERNFRDLVTHAQQIVAGTVTDITESNDDFGTPATFVTVSNLTVLKGDVGGTLTLRFFGGTSGGVVARIPDMPTFTVGERAILFVAGNGRSVCPLVGVWQGRFRVRFDATRGRDVVESHDGTPVVDIAGGEVVPGGGGAAGTADPMTVTDFLEAVAQELDADALAPTR